MAMQEHTCYPTKEDLHWLTRQQCSHQNFEIGGCRGVESKALVSHPAPILHECHYRAIDCCVLACV